MVMFMNRMIAIFRRVALRVFFIRAAFLCGIQVLFLLWRTFKFCSSFGDHSSSVRCWEMFPGRPHSLVTLVVESSQNLFCTNFNSYATTSKFAVHKVLYSCLKVYTSSIHSSCSTCVINCVNQ